jgi:hypothetical protein
LDSEIQILKVGLPDEAFRAIAEEAGAETVEIRSSTKFEDKRVDALISAVQAEEAPAKKAAKKTEAKKTEAKKSATKKLAFKAAKKSVKTPAKKAAHTKR